MQALKKRPKWVTGLRPKLEAALQGKSGVEPSSAKVSSEEAT